jgi:hypothetical protein
MPHLLRTFELDVLCPGTALEWNKRVEALGVPVTTEDWDVAFWALPTEGPYGLKVRAHMHGSSEVPALHLTLKYERLPSRPAPPVVRERSDAAGGYPGVFERLGTVFNGSRLDGTLETTFMASLSDLEGVPRLFPGSTDLNKAVFQPTILMGSIHPPIEGILEIRITRVADDVWLIGISRKILTDFHIGVVETWERESWSALQKILI